MNRTARHLFFVFHISVCLVSCSLYTHPCRAQAVNPQNYGLVGQVPRKELDSWLKGEIEQSGGRPDSQRYHFILGFSTGHYAQDPVHAIAMRRLAFSLLNNTLAPGDLVTAVAWEMKVESTSDPIVLTGDPATRAAFVNAVPYAPAPDSRGGHDIERALYDILTHTVTPEEASSTIVLLLTNTNQSQAPTGSGMALFGADNPSLLEVMHRLNYRTPPERKSFALRAGGRAVTVDVTALFPQVVAGLPDAPATPRYPTFARDTWQPAADRPGPDEALPNPALSAVQPKPPVASAPAVGIHEKQPGISPIVWILVALVAVGLTLWLLMRGRSATPGPQPAQQAKPAPVPAGKPLPGAIEVTLGGDKPVLLEKLTTESRWTLVRTAEGLALQTDEDRKAAPDAAPLAALSLEPDGKLRIEAEPRAQFTNLQGSDTRECDGRLLRLAPGRPPRGNLLSCRLVADGASRPTLLVLRYQTSNS